MRHSEEELRIGCDVEGEGEVGCEDLGGEEGQCGSGEPGRTRSAVGITQACLFVVVDVIERVAAFDRRGVCPWC